MEKRTYDIEVVGSGFGGRIASIHIKVEFDPSTETMKDFYSKACSKSFQCGYNVLHLKDINDARNSKCIWSCTECDELGKRVLEHCDKIGRYNSFYRGNREIRKNRRGRSCW